jgi:imidazolonepropionase-like amidohydrolase
MLEAGYTGKAWENQQKTRATADSVARIRADSLAALPANLKRKPTGAELRQEESGRRMRYGRENAIKLIKAGCIVSTSTDQLNPGAPEFDRAPRAIVEGGSTSELALATLNAIEGLVELGMTPLQAITAATKNGAIASHDLAFYGTIEKGKFADILLLDADPSADIHNIRKLSFVMRNGDVIDLEKLPTNPILSGRPVLIRDSRP